MLKMKMVYIYERARGANIMESIYRTATHNKQVAKEGKLRESETPPV